jgi:RHS repeat-associated protein
MRALRIVTAGLVSSFAVVFGIAIGSGEAATVGTGSADGQELGITLVVPGMQSLLGNDQAAAQLAADRANPLAVAQREASRTSFERLSAAQARVLAAHTFPSVIDQRDGGPPSLQAGSRIKGFAASNVAELELPHGKHGVLESLQPMAVETAPGRHAPIDLALTQAGNGFVPARPAVRVRIPKRLDEGVRLSHAGVSLTPVSSRGVPLNGADGEVDGAAVLYANTQTDADTLVKPTTMGFEEDTLLRSVDSPSTYYFRVAMPAGAHLVDSRRGSWVTEVVENGSVLAVVRPPAANDATGARVPASMRVSGDMLVVTVAGRAAAYQYPIALDPEVIDTEMETSLFHTWELLKNGPWFYYTSNPQAFHFEKAGLTEHCGGACVSYGDLEAPRGTEGFFYYVTKGASRIYRLVANTKQSTPTGMETSLYIIGHVLEQGVEKGIVEVKDGPLAQGTVNEVSLCSEANCNPGKVEPGHEGNSVTYAQELVKTEGGTWRDELSKASVYIEQEAGPSVKIDTTDSTLDGAPNAMWGSKWVSSAFGSAVLGAEDSDPGTGLYSETWTVKQIGFGGSSIRGYGSPATGAEVDPFACQGVQCLKSILSVTPVYVQGNNMPDGEDTIEVEVADAEGLKAKASGFIKVDSLPPYKLELLGLPSGNSLGDAKYVVTAQASDGETEEIHSSGVKSISLSLDGKTLSGPIPTPSCSPGKCTAKGQWTLEAENIPAGQHQLTVTATDFAGNVEQKTFPITVHHAAPIAVGPGSVTSQSGEFSLGATDASMGGGLTITRSYRSRHLRAGAEGNPAGGWLGPQWGLSMGKVEHIVKEPNGNAVLTDSGGGQTTFTPGEEGSFVSPPGDVNLSLSEVQTEGVKELVLANAASATSVGFRIPVGSSGETWMPTISKGPAATNTVTYAYETLTMTIGGLPRKVTRPSEDLAPVPSGVSCSPTLERGCRALTFNYAENTTATGEGPSEWGDYEHRMTRIYYTAWDPSSKEMKTVTIAQYAYDKQGRLRAVWDPRVSPALKTVYGYDAEGHVTALSFPGQEPWAFDYGTIASDSTPGRLLSVTRASASHSVAEASAPVNSSEPTTSTTSPVVGTELSVSTGQWTNNPFAYTYQWLDCGVDGNECKTIPGATNQSYRPAMSDVGHTLKAEVHALNGGGASAGAAVNSPSGVAVDNKGNVWVVESGQNRVKELSSSGELLRQFGTEGTAAGQFKSPRGIAVDATGNVWVVDTGNRRIQKFSSTGESLLQVGGVEGKEPGQFKNPEGIAVDSQGNVWVADTGNNRVQEFSSTGTFLAQFAISEYAHGITIDAAGHVWVACGSATFELGEKVVEYSSTGTVITSFGSKGTGPGQFKRPTGIAVDGKGNVWIADRGNNRVQKLSETGTYYGQVYSYKAEGVTIDSSGNMWVASASSVEEFSPSREYIKEIGSSSTLYVVKETGPPAYSSTLGSSDIGNEPFTHPYDVALDPAGDIWAVNSGNDRVEEFVAGGGYKQFGSEGTAAGQFKTPEGIAIDHSGNVWVVDSGNQRLEEFSANGTFITQIATQNWWPRTVAIDANGNLWETGGILGSEKVVEYSPSGAQLLLFGSHGNGEGQFYEPWGIAIDPKGNVWVADSVNNRLQEFSSTGVYLNQYNVERPKGIAIDSSGNVWVARFKSSSVLELSSAGVYQTSFGSSGAGNGQLKEPYGLAIASGGKIWVADTFNNRLEQFATPAVSEGEGPPPPPNPGANATSTIEYNVAVYGPGAPVALGAKEVEAWGQLTDVPAEATAVFPPDEPQSWPAHDYRRATIYYRDSLGRTVNVESPGGGISTTEYGPKNEVTRTLTADNRAEALKLGIRSREYSLSYDTENTYNSEGTELLSTRGPGHTVKLANGKEVEGWNQTFYKYDQGAPAEGGPYRLVTEVTQNAKTRELGEQDARTSTISYSGQNGLGWELRKPTSVTQDPAGLHITHTTVYDQATGNPVETWMPASGGAETAHDSKTVYYTSTANSTYPACGQHPEWANMPCETLLGKRPETPGVPNPPETITTYNMYGEPLTTTSTSGTSTKTATVAYDGSGRMESSEVTSNVGTALPKVTYKYSTATGALVEQSTTSEGKTLQTIKNAFSNLGALESYTDASGNTTTYEYETEKDARLKKINDGKGTQTYTYDETTGLLSELVDSAAHKFTAGYDVEGDLTSETYPNGMSAKYTYDRVGETTNLTYEKEGSAWFKDSVVPSIHGQWLTQASSFGSETYAYDSIGRLTESTQTPAGKGCTTRKYTYDVDTNRTKLTSYQPNAKGECSTTSGSSEESHSYDSADRLTDTGTSYDPFGGNIEKLPAKDAGGTELTSTFYVDNRLATQSQKPTPESSTPETIGYSLDPARRTDEIVSTGNTPADETLHYSGPGETPAWTSEPSGKTTREIATMNGLDAIQHGVETPTIELSNLHGDIVATAEDSEAAKGLTSTVAEPTEFGVPGPEAPPKFSWLGAHEIPTELPSGVAGMGARSYVPQIGRFLQSDPIPGGSANAYTYTSGDPVNSSDLSGTSSEPPPWLIEAIHKSATEKAEKRYAEEVAAREEAERKAAEALLLARMAAEAEFASLYGGNGGEWGEEWEEEWEEEEWEYAAAEESHGDGSIVEGSLFQPLTPGAGADEGRVNGEEGESPWVRTNVEARCRTRNSAQCHGNSASHSSHRHSDSPTAMKAVGHTIEHGKEIYHEGKGAAELAHAVWCDHMAEEGMNDCGEAEL